MSPMQNDQTCDRKIVCKLGEALTSIWSSRVKKKLRLLQKKLLIDKGLTPSVHHKLSFGYPIQRHIRPPALTCYSDVGVLRLTCLHQTSLEGQPGLPGGAGPRLQQSLCLLRLRN